jgi:hypothetical protein
MTLREKFTEILYKQSQDDSECLRIRFENIDKVIDSQKDIADEFAIGFANWIRVCKLKGRPYDFENIKELLIIYKEEKEL